MPVVLLMLIIFVGLVVVGGNYVVRQTRMRRLAERDTRSLRSEIDSLKDLVADAVIEKHDRERK